MKSNSDLKKTVLGLAGGGVALGLALAFLIELVLDRTVKRPVEVEKLLGAPILLSIPYVNGHSRLRWPRARERSIALQNGQSSPWDADHFIRRYSEAIRDRLVLYFELNRLNHKPKLVAVSGCSDGAGASTLAGGIAAALSETGDGKVLLVDMNVGRPEIHPFFRGAPACSLAEALGRGACSGWGESLSGKGKLSERAARSARSKKVLRPDAAPESERLRLHYFRHAALQPDEHRASHVSIHGQGGARCGG